MSLIAAILHMAEEFALPGGFGDWDRAYRHNKAAVAVANKMARIVWAVWSRLTPFAEIQKAA